jgi:hypothetical protein
MDCFSHIKEVLYILSIVSCVGFSGYSIWLLCRHKWGKIAVNVDKLAPYFGEKSFVHKQYVAGLKDKAGQQVSEEKKEEIEKKLETGLLKAHRHFYLPWFYAFFFGIFIFAILLFQLRKEDKKRAEIPVRMEIKEDKEDPLPPNDSIKISITIFRDDSSWHTDIYSTDIKLPKDMEGKIRDTVTIDGTGNDTIKFILCSTETAVFDVLAFVDTAKKTKEAINIKVNFKGNAHLLQFWYKTHKKKDAYQSLLTILSMLTNVFLLSFFGFLNTKTDVFDQETDEDNYSILNMTSIFIFLMVCVIEGIYIYYPTFPSLYFAIETIVAIISVIAVFGIWGCMYNQYTKFKPVFRIIIFVYAAAQIFAVFLSVNPAISICLLIVVLVGKLFIMWQVSKWVSSRGLSWFFLNEANEKRADNDKETDSYKAFVQLLTEVSLLNDDGREKNI